ncbi:MAG: hypothetical protein II628_16585 [Lachnospiraceae bacterium]|nr:hypothetical protein [Lachnospiraceae bacterium]
MFGKVFKYEMKAVRRILLPLYGAMILVALLFGLTTILTTDFSGVRNGLPMFVDIVEIILSMLFFTGLTACGVVTFVVLIRRFYSDFLGSEGYLQLALPVTTNVHLAARTLTAFLWTLLSGLTAFLSLTVLVFIFSFKIQDLGGFFRDILNMVGSLEIPPLSMVLLLVSGLTSCLAGIAHLYASIAIGSLWSGHRMIGSVLAFIGTGFVWSALNGFIGTVFDKTARAFPLGINGIPLSLEYSVLAAVIFLALVQFILYYLIAWLILDKALNLD